MCLLKMNDALNVGGWFEDQFEDVWRSVWRRSHFTFGGIWSLFWPNTWAWWISLQSSAAQFAKPPSVTDLVVRLSWDCYIRSFCACFPCLLEFHLYRFICIILHINYSIIDPFHVCGNAANLENKTNFRFCKTILLFCTPVWLHSHRREKGSILAKRVSDQVKARRRVWVSV